MYTFMDQEKAFMMTLDDMREEGREEGTIQEAVRLYNEELGLTPLPPVP